MTYLKIIAASAAAMALCACATTQDTTQADIRYEAAAPAPMAEKQPEIEQDTVSETVSEAVTEPDAAQASEPTFDDHTLFYNAMTQWELQGFVDAVRAAGLDGTLEGDIVYTVFAPNSDAIERADAVDATALKAHIVEGRYTQAELKSAIAEKGSLSLTSLAGTEVKFYNFSDSLRIAGADGVLVNFAGTERDSSNGVVHQITSVIAPQ